MMTKDFSKRLLAWREKYGRRGLPWQGQIDPYRVWLSEIMLQQTQVATVIPKYEAFLQKFPTVKDLALASEQEVMAIWAGMGYYTRARNLWACAKHVVNEYGGFFPKSSDILQTLPGIGPSTAAAIASFCFMEKKSILDGNVKRVLSRIFGVTQPINQAATEKQLWTLASHLLPRDEKSMPHYTQALMDFGATACTPKKVLCQNKKNAYQRACIFEDQCQAFLTDKVDVIPVKLAKKKTPQMTSELLLVFHQNKILLEKRPAKGIWGGLWSLPETTWKDTQSPIVKNSRLSEDLNPRNLNHVREGLGSYLHLEALSSQGTLPNEWQQAYAKARALAPIKHVFTHRILYFRPMFMKVKEEIRLPTPMAWFSQSEIEEIGLPTPIKKLLESFLNSEII